MVCDNLPSSAVSAALVRFAWELDLEGTSRPISLLLKVQYRNSDGMYRPPQGESSASIAATKFGMFELISRLLRVMVDH